MNFLGKSSQKGALEKACKNALLGKVRKKVLLEKACKRIFRKKYIFDILFSKKYSKCSVSQKP